MISLKEVTVWADGTTSNHTYLLDGDKMVAYIKKGTTEPYYFKNPIKGFSRSGRKFEEVQLDWSTLLQVHVKTEPQPNFIKKVQGSKPGVTYEVNTDENTCTCPGFSFRGKCKHVEQD